VLTAKHQSVGNKTEGVLQKMFSTFPSGWPGVGLLVQRMLTATLLVRFGVIDSIGKSFSPSMTPEVIVACAGIFLLVGLGTPIAGGLIAVIESWTVMTRMGDPWFQIVTGSLGGTVAMIGPGAWSIDARLFGRKHVEM
jgi:putative oxidoreductase